MIANADAARIPLPDKSVHAVITSPPYFGPRKYKGEQARDWPAVSYSPMPGLPPLEVPAMRCELGREATPESYVAHLVLCFREVYRVLRDDGAAWCVIGDSFAGGGGYYPDSPSNQPDAAKSRGAPGAQLSGARIKGQRNIPGLKQGDLMAIPYRLLLALQADGWLVRNDVVWSKVAPMPESVAGTRWERHRVKVGYDDKKECPKAGPYYGGASSTLGYPGWRKDLAETGHKAGTQWIDCPGCPKCSATGGYVLRRGSWRHTRSHETVIMLTKGMQYFSDQERVREKESENSHGGKCVNPGQKNIDLGKGKGGYLGLAPHQVGAAGRNPRDVLTPSPSPFKGEHYAAFPPDLIRPLILSSAPLKCCPVCGAGWAAVVEQNGNPSKPFADYENAREFDHDGKTANPQSSKSLHRNDGGVYNHSNVIGYRPTCVCVKALAKEYTGAGSETTLDEWANRANEVANRLAPVPGLVLDPFAGSGTTGVVCREMGLRFVGLDISMEYLNGIALARSELKTPAASLVTLPMFAALSGAR